MDNLFRLLDCNLQVNKSYNIFILTDFKNTDINKKNQFLNSRLGKYSIKIHLINRIKDSEDFNLHDRLLYTNYTITESPSGFNLKRNKPGNSEISTSSIFEKYTYRKYINHMRGIKNYLEKLERFEHYDNPIKVIPTKTFKEFENLIYSRFDFE